MTQKEASSTILLRTSRLWVGRCEDASIIPRLDIARDFFIYLTNSILSNRDTVEAEGEITETLPNTQFRVTLDAGQEIIAHLSGKMRVHHIRVMPGDRVRVAMSPYDLTKGRIIVRLG